MTSTTGMAGHPDVTEISDLTEGLLSPSRSADVRRHLDGCTACAEVYDSLEEIRGLLGTLPGPSRMPADVAERMDAALAAEALLNATAPVSASADTLSPVGGASRSGAGAGAGAGAGDERQDRGESNDDSGHVSRETSTVTDRPAGHSRAATGPGRTNRPPRRGRRRTVALGAMVTAAALGLGGLLVQLLESDSSDNDSASPSAQQSDSANTFAGERLEKQVADLLAKAEKKDSGPRSSRPQGTESLESPSVLTLPTDSVPVCINRGIGRDAPPLASREGSYRGKDAYLVVLPAVTDTSQVTAYVVDSACVGKPSISAGKVLLEHSYPRN